MKNNQLTRFDTKGQEHENSKLGGIPQGISSDGKMNTVETGETKVKNYLYSDRLSIDENMTKEMSLPSYIKGKTFASASKAIDNKFKDRNDKYSNETKNTLLERLKQAQETLKQQEQERAEQIAQSMQANQQQLPDMMNGEIPEGMEEYSENQNGKQFFLGGNISESEVGNQTGGMSGLAGQMSPFLKNTSSIGGYNSYLENKYKYNPNLKAGDESMEKVKDTIEKIPVVGQFASIFRGVEKAGNELGVAVGGETGGDVATGILDPSSGQREVLQSKDSTALEKGASIIAPFASGLIARKGRERTKAKMSNANSLSYNSKFQDNNFAYGGNLKKYDNGGYTTSGNPLIIPNEGMSNINERYPFESMFKPTNTIPQVGAGKPSNFLGYSIKPKNVLPKPPLADDFIAPTNLEDIKKYQSSKGLIADGIVGPKTNAQFDLDRKNWTPETPDTTMLKPKEQDFVEPTGIRQGMEDYYQNNKTTSTDTTQNNNTNWLDRNGGKFLKYAPVAMNAYQLAKLKKPVNQRLQRLDDKYKAQYVDEAALQNVANQEMTNTINGISQSGASQGAIRSSILGAGLNKTKALSDAYMKADAENRLTDDKAQQFNLGVNQFNTQVQQKESENWERNEANYRNEKSKYLASIGTDLGQIGKEEVNKNQIAAALGYSWDGKYMVNKKTGEKKTYEDVVNQTKQNSYGGYLKMNKIGRR